VTRSDIVRATGALTPGLLLPHCLHLLMRKPGLKPITNKWSCCAGCLPNGGRWSTNRYTMRHKFRSSEPCLLPTM